MADFQFVLPRAAVGSAITGPADVDALVAAGITCVIDGRAEFDDAALLATHPSLLYCWDGTDDDGQPKPASWFGKALAFTLPLYAQPNAKAYFHCAGGINRGPSLCYAFMRALGFSAGDGESLIRHARPQVQLRYIPDAEAALPILGY